MSKGIIQLYYRKIINSESTKAWDRFVFEDSYTEFLMQAQYYDQGKKYASFSELLSVKPGAEKLHFLVSSAIVGYIKQLNGIMPDIQNNLGKIFVPFTNFRFEIIETHTSNKKAHQVAINFLSDPLIWHETIGNNLLVSVKDIEQQKDVFLTDVFSLQPMVSIYSLNDKPDGTTTRS